jgi:uncharacterized membrane protein YgdD (TMEM256/DUF423 family)
MPTTLSPSWSWKRSLLHAALAFGVAVAIGAAAFAVLQRPESNATKFGEGVGRLSVFTAAVVFAASWLRQTGRRRAAIGLVAGFVALLGGLFAVLTVLPRGPGAHRVRALSSADRAPLVVVEAGGQRRLRHPTLGFSLLHPGAGFRDAPEVAAAMSDGRDPDAINYGFQEPASQSALVVSVMYGMGGSREKLSEHLDGVQRGVAGSVVGKSDLRWLNKEISWDDHRHVGRLSVSIAGQTRMELASYSVAPAGGDPFIVNLFVMTRQPDRFADLLASFRE